MRHVLFYHCATRGLTGSSRITKAQSEIGHYGLGVLSIRDFAVPDSGFYALLYTYGYNTHRLNDADGNEIDSVTIIPRGYLYLPMFMVSNAQLKSGTQYFIRISSGEIFSARNMAPDILNHSGSNATMSGGVLLNICVQGRGALQRHSGHIGLCVEAGGVQSALARLEYAALEHHVGGGPWLLRTDWKVQR